MKGDPLVAASELLDQSKELLELVKDNEQNINTLQLKALVHTLNETAGYILGIKSVLLTGLE